MQASKRDDYDELAISVYKEGCHYPTVILLKGEERQVVVMKNENDEKIYLTKEEAKGMLKNYVHDNNGSQYGIIIFEEKTSNSLIRITYYRSGGTFSAKVLLNR